MAHLLRNLLCVLAACVAAMAFAGCGDTAGSGTKRISTKPRVVTLSPALTQMAVDFGRADHLVGVAHHDYAAPDHLPVVGNFLDVNAESLLAQRPTHVVLMTGGRQQPADGLAELAEQGGFEVVNYSPYPRSVEDVLHLVHSDRPVTPPRLGELLHCDTDAEQLRQRLQHTFERLEQLTADRLPVKTLMLFSLQPYVASGPHSVLNDMLHHAGGTNAVTPTLGSEPSFGAESVIKMQPEVILLLLPREPDLRENDPRIAGLAAMPIPAAKQGRIHLINDPLALLPTTTIDRVALNMARLLHPQLSDKFDALEASRTRDIDASTTDESHGG